MIYFCAAIYPEAAPILSHFSMKSEGGRYGTLYRSPEAVLILCGIGPVSCALAMAEAFTRIPPSATDVLVQIGICGAPAEEASLWEWFRINKITECDTGRDFYPDVFLSGSFPEHSLRTVSTVSEAPDSLVDMEAAAAFQAGRPFFSPERMLFYKCVSDFGTVSLSADASANAGAVTPDAISAHVAEALPRILSEAAEAAKLSVPDRTLNAEEEAAVIRLAERIDASAAMTQELHRLSEYLLYRDGSPLPALEHALLELTEPIHRKEGKLYLEQFRKDCLS